MQDGRISFGFRAALATLALAFLVSSSWAANVRKLHNFGLTGDDGRYPQYGSLVFDSYGNLYGTTTEGGNNACSPHGCGAVYQLKPNGDGTWTAMVIHYFGNGTDGITPQGTLVFDHQGNMFGTTSAGGNYGKGTVYEVSPDGNGGFREQKIHNFGSGSDGATPYAGLVFYNGNLYGTTSEGGNYGEGTAFEMVRNSDGTWTETKMHNFGINGADGSEPYAGLTVDAAGNFYGTTWTGGASSCNCGTVYQITSNGDGTWNEHKLHTFGMNSADGAYPNAEVIMDSAGNLYGTTTSGGNYTCDSAGCGTAYELTPNGNGTWAESKIHNFGANAADSAVPWGPLVLDNSGNLYGTTEHGGNYQCDTGTCGTIFRLTSNGSGGWTAVKVHNFGTESSDGTNPYGGLIFDASGNLYGATYTGGDYGVGAVFIVTP